MGGERGQWWRVCDVVACDCSCGMRYIEIMINGSEGCECMVYSGPPAVVTH